MALLLQNNQKQHLKLLDLQTVKVLTNILENIASGKIANVSDNDTLVMTQAVMKLVIDARQLQLPEKEFVSQVKTQTGLKDETAQTLWSFLDSNPSLDDLIGTNEYKFRDLEWRLEAKVASRYSRELPPEPRILMKVHLDREKSLQHRLTLPEALEGSSKKELVMESDVNSLVHIIDQLESARTAVNMKRVTQLPPQ